MAHFVHLSGSQHRFSVESGETILAAGLRQGLALPFGCQSGGCGSCRVRLLSGPVTYPATPTSHSRALSEAEIQAGYILMCQAQAAGDVELLLHQPEGLEQRRPRPWTAKVIEHRILSHDVAGLWVKLPQGPQPFRFLPGQYVDFLLVDAPRPFESGPRAEAIPIRTPALAPSASHSRQTPHKRRSFSIAKANAADSILEFHLRITPGGLFAHYVQDEMPDRTLLRFEGPLGAFYLREDSARPALLMAGGTGFAPIKAMLEHQIQHGGAAAGVIEKDLGSPALALGAARPLHLFWGARSSRDLYQDALAREWAARHPWFRYTPVLSEPEAGWTGERGLVHEILLQTYPRLDGHEVYMAGPPAMVHAGKRAFAAAGLVADHLFYDSFDYAFETWPALG